MFFSAKHDGRFQHTNKGSAPCTHVTQCLIGTPTSAQSRSVIGGQLEHSWGKKLEQVRFVIG